MRNITKGPEPASLTAWRAENPTNYLDYPGKEALRASLVSEQRGLCCYCESRIYPDRTLMKIEHWESHNGHPEQRVVYSNLLGACMGREGKPGRDQHCDTYKGEKDLCRNPASPAHDVGTLVHYLNDGRVTSSNDLLNEQLESVLNLNHPLLVENRKQTLESLIRLIQQRGVTLNRAKWQRIIADWDGANDADELPPFCSVIVYWARKHLRHA